MKENSELHLDSVFYSTLYSTLKEIKENVEKLASLPEELNFDELRSNLLLLEQKASTLTYFKEIIEKETKTQEIPLEFARCNALLLYDLPMLIFVLSEKRFSLYFEYLDVLEKLNLLLNEKWEDEEEREKEKEEYKKDVEGLKNRLRGLPDLVGPSLNDILEDLEDCKFEKPFYSSRP